MKQSTYKTTTYELEKGWMLDIIEYEDLREAWIYRIDIGIKSMMYGYNKNNDSYEEFVKGAARLYTNYTDDYMHDFA